MREGENKGEIAMTRELKGEGWRGDYVGHPGENKGDREK